MTISEVADRYGLTPDTLRYYERAGLIPPAEDVFTGYEEQIVALFADAEAAAAAATPEPTEEPTAEAATPTPAS